MQNNADSIVNALANLKIELIKQVDGLSEKLINEFTKLSEIQEAVSIEQAHLKELYDINETTKTLSALIFAQQEQKNSFDQQMEEETQNFELEIEQKRTLWKQQQEELSTNYKDLKEQLEKTRKRNEEEYQYNLDLKRKKEMDECAMRKSALEKDLIKMREELDERAGIIKNKENEFTEMQQKIANFTKEIAVVREEAIKNTREQLETQFKFANELNNKGVDGERKLNTQKIMDLESKIKEQEKLILQLTQKADTAVSQVQDIARRALDTSAKRFGSLNYYSPSEEKIDKDRVK